MIRVTVELWSGGLRDNDPADMILGVIDITNVGTDGATNHADYEAHVVTGARADGGAAARDVEVWNFDRGRGFWELIRETLNAAAHELADA